MSELERTVQESLAGSITAKQEFVRDKKADIIRLARLIADTLRAGGKLLIFGNGGSAADAQHMAAEFVNRFLLDRPPLAAIALTTDTSIITAVGNDFTFDDIFVKQIMALGRDGDVALGISTSGNSANVIRGVQTASERGLKTAALTGGSGGKLAAAAGLVLNVASHSTPHIQETHLWAEHILCQLVDQILFGEHTS